MFVKQMNNEKGFTMVELLIAMVIGMALLATATYTYTKQSDVIRSGNQETQTRGMARMVLDEMVVNIRRAGYGMPPGDSVAGRPARGITAASATAITFRANTDNVTTSVAFDSTSPSNTSLLVEDYTDFTDGDQVVFFDTETPSNWNARTLRTKTAVSFGGNTYFEMDWGSGVVNENDFPFTPLDNNAAVVVNKYHTISYTYNSGPQTITVTDDMGTDSNGDDTTVTVASNVTDVTLSYFDAAGNSLSTLPLSSTDLGNVRRMGISITVKDRIEDTVTRTADTDITLRNMGI